MSINEFKETELYINLYQWLTDPETTEWIPTDSEISQVKKIWIDSNKDNSDFVFGQLNWLNYFED